MKTRTKIASLLLAAVLLLGLLPAGVFSTAAEGLVLEFDTPDDAGLKRLYPKEPNSATNPYLVTSAEDWSNLTCVTPMRYEYYFLQTADIDLNTEMPTDEDVSKNVEYMIPSFKGHYDGGGHSFSGLHVKGNANMGLFAYATGATIENLTIKNCSFYAAAGNKHVGAVIGSAKGTGTGIADINLTNKDSWKEEDLAKATNIIRNVVVDSSVEIANYLPEGSTGGGGRYGGLIGDAAMSNSELSQIVVVENCVVRARITMRYPAANCFVGGIVGCSSNTKMDTTAASGSFVNYVSLTVKNCVCEPTFVIYARQSADDMSEIGGIAGDANSNSTVISNCAVKVTAELHRFDEGEKAKTKEGFGGLIGTLFRTPSVNQSAVIENCVATVAVTNETDIPAGGLIGRLSGSPVTLTNNTYYSAEPAVGLVMVAKKPTVNGVVLEKDADVDQSKFGTLETKENAEKTYTSTLIQNFPLVMNRLGAAVKADAQNADIRFVVIFSNAAADVLKSILGADKVTFGKGALVAPESVELQKGATGVKDIAYTDESAANVDGLANHYAAVSDTIASKDYTVSYHAAGYVTVTYEGTETVVLGNVNGGYDYSVKAIAGLAAADEKANYNAESLAAFKALAGIQ